MVWFTAYLPIRHKKTEDKEQKIRKQHYVAVVLSRNFRLLAVRAKMVQGTVIATKAANGSVNDKTKEQAKLNFDPIINDWELMSLFPLEILTSILDLRKVINEHNFDIDRAGGAFGDNNFGDQIIRRANAIQKRCNTLSHELQRFVHNKTS